MGEWIAVLVFLLGAGIGWVGRMHYDAEARRDERAIDDALARAWRAGWRSARDERL